MNLKSHLIFTLYTIYGILLKVMASKGKARGISGQYPLVQNVTVTEGGTANMTCRVEYNDNTSLQWSNPAQQTLFFGDKKALRDNRIELVHASWSELTISISDVTLTDEGMYTCSLFTMPVRTAKAYLTVLGVPEKPEIDGLMKPALEGDHITLTCMTQGSKPAADLRWFRNEKEVKGAKEVNASGKTFTVRSSLQLHVDRNDDGVAYTCKVDHVALTQTPQQATEVLEVHYAPRVQIIHSLAVPQEGQYLKLECVSKGNPSPDPVMWTKDGGELPDLDRMIVEGRELTFTSLNKTDNGTYRCEAGNHLGTSSAEYVLYVYDVPTTLPPSTTPPLHSIPPDPTALLGSHASDPTVTGNRAISLPQASVFMLHVDTLRHGNTETWKISDETCFLGQISFLSTFFSFSYPFRIVNINCASF
ncbi:cell adhesion molecule 2a isoform X3 [Cebidichthys violaceus]|uniref:cell adhesion molecule 2a isoform X3 n=1 Tax=Cebidichthys violaceus TaxID=271503 RepID=UPI0035CB2965